MIQRFICLVQLKLGSRISLLQAFLSLFFTYNHPKEHILMSTSEKIMVCVSNNPNGIQLIRRGGQLAELYQCPFYVLHVWSENGDNLVFDKNSNDWEKLSKEYKATYIFKKCPSNQVSDVIAEVSLQNEITQLIIGQPGITRWKEIMHGSIVNELFNKLKQIDIHIIATQEKHNKL